MALSSADIKRQILQSTGSSSIRKKVVERMPGIPDGEQIEMGNDLDAVTRTRGWTLIESYMLRRMNLVGIVMADEENKDQKGIARGFIELMQWIQLMIQNRDDLLQKEKQKYAKAEDVSKNEGE